jgi:hypothetical protein
VERDDDGQQSDDHPTTEDPFRGTGRPLVLDL